jgi:Na+-transporting methylmalonyl-CoA/oxaloacetate decarboxylase gamma subunit
VITTILGGLGAAFALFAVISFFVFVVILIGVVVYKRSTARGVVFKDGVSNDEAKIVLEEISKVAQEDKAREALLKASVAIKKAVDRFGKTPTV